MSRHESCGPALAQISEKDNEISAARTLTVIPVPLWLSYRQTGRFGLPGPFTNGGSAEREVLPTIHHFGLMNGISLNEFLITENQADWVAAALSKNFARVPFLSDTLGVTAAGVGMA